MFNALREKLKNWTKKVSKSEQESEEPEEVLEETPLEKPTKKEKAKKAKPEKPSKEAKKKSKEKSSEKEKKKSEKTGKEEISLPMKFNPGMEKFEPDLEKLKEEAEKESIKEKKPFFQNLVSKGSKIKITERDFENYKDDLEMLLLENNVAFEASDEIIKKLKEEIVGKEILKKELESEIRFTLRDIISKILIEPFDIIKKILEKKDKNKDPFVILFFGINGSGKTTSIAKLSEFLSHKKISSVLAAADTFRAASIEQLKEHGKKLGTKVIAHEYGSDPAAVGFDAIQYARKNKIDCVLIDTAGRMHTESNLIREMEKISKVCKPDLKIFIGESITGNDATEQARTFNQNIGIDGIILSKSDIDEKGGTALSVGFVTGKPIIFLGTGQNYKDIEYFDKNKFLSLLGLE